MYVILGGGNVIPSDQILMMVNLKRCNFELPDNLRVEDPPNGVALRTLIITVDGRGIYTNSMVSTIIKRIKRWGKAKDV